MEVLAILVPFLAAILVVFIAHFLNRSRDEANRESNRSLNVLDKNIKEARAYVDKWNDYLFTMNDINSKLLRSSNNHDRRRVLDVEMQNLNQLSLSLEEITKQVSILHILDDDELLDWHRKIVPAS